MKFNKEKDINHSSYTVLITLVKKSKIHPADKGPLFFILTRKLVSNYV